MSNITIRERDFWGGRAWASGFWVGFVCGLAGATACAWLALWMILP